MTEIEKRKRLLINAAYVALIVGVFYLFVKYAMWDVFPFLIAAFIAIALQKPIRLLTKKTKLKKPLASGLCVAALMIVAGGLIFLIGIRLYAEIKSLFSFLVEKSKDVPAMLDNTKTALLNAATHFPKSLADALTKQVNDLFARLDKGLDGGKLFGTDISSWISKPLSGIWSTAKMIPSAFVGVIITIVASFFVAFDYDRITSFIKRQFKPEKRAALSASKNIMLSTLGKMARAYLTLMLITFCEMLLGLNILSWIGVYDGGYIVAIALITALVDILPVFGSGTILLPWAVFSFIVGETGLGIGLLVIYACIWVIRQVIEPKIVASNIGLPPTLTLLCIFLGYQIFGILGLFLLPISLIFFKILNDEGLLKLWKNAGDYHEELKEKAAQEAGKNEPPGETAPHTSPEKKAKKSK